MSYNLAHNFLNSAKENKDPKFTAARGNLVRAIQALDKVNPFDYEFKTHPGDNGEKVEIDDGFYEKMSEYQRAVYDIQDAFERAIGALGKK